MPRTAADPETPYPESYAMADKSADEIVSHYNEADEASRLRTGWFQLEQARTQELILRYIPPRPPGCSMLGAGPAPMPAG